MDVLVDYTPVGLCFKWDMPGQDLIQHHPKRINIGAVVGFETLRLFGGDVGRRAADHTRGSLCRGVGNTHQSKISNDRLDLIGGHRA